MSPEQVIGKNLDHRTDIFSLGVVLYEILTALPPFDGDNVNAIMYATVNHMPQPPSLNNPDVPTMLDLIVAKALAKSVDERYQSMREMVQDLNEVKRILHATIPAGKVIARSAPSQPKPVSLEALGIGVGRYKKDEDEAPVAPLTLAKKFDSFDATLKLAAMTNQTKEFETYISETKKMRAYRGEHAGEVSAPPSKQKPASRATLSQTSSVETGTVPIAQLEEMELAARAYAAKQARETGETADIDLSALGERSAAKAPPSPAIVLGVIAMLVVVAIGLIVRLIVR
jgi:serine/threonine protein kinase